MGVQFTTFKQHAECSLQWTDTQQPVFKAAGWQHGVKLVHTQSCNLARHQALTLRAQTKLFAYDSFTLLLLASHHVNHLLAYRNASAITVILTVHTHALQRVHHLHNCKWRT